MKKIKVLLCITVITTMLGGCVDKDEYQRMKNDYSRLEGQLETLQNDYDAQKRKNDEYKEEIANLEAQLAYYEGDTEDSNIGADYKEINILIGSDSNFNVYLDSIVDGMLILRFENLTDENWNVGVKDITINDDNFTSMVSTECFANKSVKLELNNWNINLYTENGTDFDAKIPKYDSGSLSGRAKYSSTSDGAVTYINISGVF